MRDKINRVAIIGAGAVGCSYAYSLINQGAADEITLIDLDEKRAEGEAMDLNHGVPFSTVSTKIKSGSYEDCNNVDLAVITAGLPQKPGETRLQLIDKNAKIMKSIVNQIMSSGFDGIILVATNPVDILSYVAWRESGLPKERVIGSGTTLDTARFKYLLGEYLEVDPRNVHASIMGEHGDTEFPVWSQASIGIENLQKVLERRDNPADKEELGKIFVNVRDAAYHMIDRKGATYYGIGMCLTRITKAIFDDENSILPLSCLMEGQYGEEGLYISVPAIVNRAGIREVIEIELDEEEHNNLTESAKVMKELIAQVYK
ncbi:L-lactate dehydrogenase [Paenibacillus sp.]|jgi:L-lactate dehydrogenase|uniref:L-lactate dehydrogenase n=1 Tax=Paenibacillus sp. TaxID=58172 RepID=UPI002826455F|nr:L-lactate dehydrogenase [Paenibacillus sp.]MDR0270548.1 L-lactate dehydrogenase [Paenibacillus sp.]